MSEHYTDYYIDKWSRIVRIRDGHICQSCEEEATSRRKMHAHHIDRKVDNPEKALDLNNGICLCERCHLSVIHSTHTNHKKFRVIFKRWVRRKANKEFNIKWQHKLVMK